MSAAVCNVAARLADAARRAPDQPAVVVQGSRRRDGSYAYQRITLGELDQDSDRFATGLREMGVVRGTRMALLVKPGIDFVCLVFALLKAGAVPVLIDPGMGPRNVLACLDEVAPEGFVALPFVHALRVVLRRRFAKARLHVTAGRRWFWGGRTLAQFRKIPWKPFEITPTGSADPAAIIFTSGSTGPPKGVLYRHGNFDCQVTEIRDAFGVRAGDVNVACFPLFALFDAAMCVTTVFPRMDFSRPARVDPARIVSAVHDWGAIQAFGSPAVWNRVGEYCRQRQVKMNSLRRVLSAGAPVPPRVLELMRDCIHPDGEMHTPYGATEALPVATIETAEVLGTPRNRLGATMANHAAGPVGNATGPLGTAAHWRVGAGTCVGRRFPGIEWKIIQILDGAISRLTSSLELRPREVGELIVRGPVVTDQYCTRLESNALAKIQDETGFWHRMGDVGYLDDLERFWYCGRLSQRVVTERGILYTDPCEAIFCQHPDIHRAALVGIGPREMMRPVIICEPRVGRLSRASHRQRLIEELRQLAESQPLTQAIRDFLLHPSFPVDVRHNSKISREQLARWAAKHLSRD